METDNKEKTQTENSPSEKTYGNSCDRRDVKLKEAEKTIANKDVIIKMLRDQVKKLEESCKQNMKETESFRYRYCLASEQMKRLRCSSSEPKEKLSKECRCEVTAWKPLCHHQLPVVEEYCSSTCMLSCNYVQQIKNIENFMKTHQHLLQTLTDKIPNVERSRSKEDNDEMQKLQEELNRLKNENATLRSDLPEEYELPQKGRRTLLSAKDSVLETYRRNNIQLHQQVSSLMEKIGFEDDDDSQHSEGTNESLKKITFSQANLIIESADEELLTKITNVEEGEHEITSEVKQPSKSSLKMAHTKKKLPEKETDEDREQEAISEFKKPSSSELSSIKNIGSVPKMMDTQRSENGIKKESSGTRTEQKLSVSISVSKVGNITKGSRKTPEDAQGCYCITNGSRKTPEDGQGCYCSKSDNEIELAEKKEKEDLTNEDEKKLHEVKIEQGSTQNELADLKEKETDEDREKEATSKFKKNCKCSSVPSTIKNIESGPKIVDEYENKLHEVKIEEEPTQTELTEKKEKEIDEGREKEAKSKLKKNCKCSSIPSTIKNIESGPKIVDAYENKLHEVKIEEEPTQTELAEKNEKETDEGREKEAKSKFKKTCKCGSVLSTIKNIESGSKIVEAISEFKKPSSGSEPSSIRNIGCPKIMDTQISLNAIKKNSSGTRNELKISVTISTSKVWNITEENRKIPEVKGKSNEDFQDIKDLQDTHSSPMFNANEDAQGCYCPKSDNEIELTEKKEKDLTTEQEPTTLGNNNLDDVVSKLNNITNKVLELLQKQTNTSQEIEVLKSDILTTRKLTEECILQLSKLAETLNKQNETIEDNNDQHKAAITRLKQSGEKTQQELSEVKAKTEEICKRVENLEKVRQEYEDKKDEESDVITLEECQNIIYELHDGDPPIPTETNRSVGYPSPMHGSRADVIHSATKKEEVPQQPCLCKQLSGTTKDGKKSVDLNDSEHKKDEKIKCINALLTYWKEARKHFAGSRTSVEIRKYIDEHLQQCTCENDEIHKYIQKVRGENLKLKTTISNIIDHLNTKLDELKGVEDQRDTCSCNKNEQCSEILILEDFGSCPCESNICHTCEYVHSELEIEDIYNAVRRSVMPQCSRFNSSSSCLCTRINNKPSFTCSCEDSFQIEEDNYSSFLCVYDCTKSREFIPLCGSTTISQRKQQKSPDAICDSEHKCDVDNCKSGELISSLETYVRYLHEQLNIITNVEDQIEDLRLHINTP